MRRVLSVLLVLGLIPALLAANTGDEPTVTDACGGGSIPHLDICATWIAPLGSEGASEQGFEGLELDLVIDGWFEDRQPTDQWAMFFTLDDACWANVIVFRDTADTLDVTTMLNHFCESETGGLNVLGRAILEDVQMNGRLLHVEVPDAALDEVGIDLSFGDTLTNVYSLTWMGQTTSAGPQAVYTWDSPDSRGSVTLEEG